MPGRIKVEDKEPRRQITKDKVGLRQEHRAINPIKRGP